MEIFIIDSMAELSDLLYTHHLPHNQGNKPTKMNEI